MLIAEPPRHLGRCWSWRLSFCPSNWNLVWFLSAQGAPAVPFVEIQLHGEGQPEPELMGHDFDASKDGVSRTQERPQAEADDVRNQVPGNLSKVRRHGVLQQGDIIILH